MLGMVPSARVLDAATHPLNCVLNGFASANLGAAAAVVSVGGTVRCAAYRPVGPGLSRWVAGLSRSGRGDRSEQFRASVCRVEVEAELQFCLDQIAQFVEPGMRISELIDRRPGLSEPCRIMHPLLALRKLVDHAVQLADLRVVRGGVLLALHTLQLV